MTLNVNNVTKKFGDKIAVNNISFTLGKGSMLGFLGGNGAGKTTTFRMLLGLTNVTHGTITYNGTIVNKHNYNNIGYLPEERGLHPKLKFISELKYLSSLKGLTNKDANKKIKYWLKRFNLDEYKNQKIQSLSKGNQQKVQLLASILHSPELLILDEPFSGLDPVNVELLKSIVKDLNQNGTTIIFSTHRMDHVEELCDEICLLKKGNMILQGNIDEIKNKFNEKKVIIKSSHDLNFLQNIDGVKKRVSNRNEDTFYINNISTGQKLFEEVKKLDEISKFEIIQPSLNDIFINKVGDDFV